MPTLRMVMTIGVCMLLTMTMRPAADATSAVLVVDPGSALASDLGPGSAKRPFKTLSAAVRRLMPGDEMVIASGIYREALILPERKWSKEKPTIIRAKDEHPPILKGSKILEGLVQTGEGILLKEQWEVNTQQVFLDGAPLQQIGGTVFGGFPEDSGHPLQKLHVNQGGVWPGRTAGDETHMPPGSFYYDKTSKKLYVRLPEGRNAANSLLEASVRPYLLYGTNISGLILQGLAFTHSNTSDKHRHGAVTLIDSNDNRIEGIAISRADGVGLHLKGHRNTVRSCRIEYAGRIGIAAKGRNDVFENNVTNFCNTRGFNLFWEAGGCKFIGGGGLQQSKIIGHEAMYNAGDGIWFDQRNADNAVLDSTCAYNSGHGIHYEVCSGGRFAGNHCYGNAKRGIYLPSSSDCQVYNNLVAFNGLEGIAAVVAGRKDRQGRALTADGNLVFGNLLAWNNRRSAGQHAAELILPEKSVGNRSDANLFITDDGRPGFSIGFAGFFGRPEKGLAGWRAATGQDPNSWQVQAEPPFVLLGAVRQRSKIAAWGILDDLARTCRLPENRLEGTPQRPGPTGLPH